MAWTYPRLHEPRYPGVDLPLRHIRLAGYAGEDFYRMGSSEGAKYTQSGLLQVREVAMLMLMDRLTDHPNWQEAVFDDAIVATWRTEALGQPEDAIYQEIVGEKRIPMPKRTRIMTEAAFNYCIAELRCKAALFNETGLVLTLNAVTTNQYDDVAVHNMVFKTDSLVDDQVQQSFKAAFDKLRAEQGVEPDWHPNSDDVVQDLVHPSMYPFVYAKTKFIQEEVVGVVDAIDKWSGKGEVVPQSESDQRAPRGQRPSDYGDWIDRTYWSRTYQWLPANLAFQDDGTVRFTSYINNLHPKKHPEIYRLVERLVDTVLPAWERVLPNKPPVDESGQPQKRFGLPPPIRDDAREHKYWETFNADILAAIEEKEGPIENWFFESELAYPESSFYESDCEDADKDENGPTRAWKLQKLKWREVRDPLLPEPVDFKPVTYPSAGEVLRGKFKDTGFQVMVKMTSIELTPEKPVCPADEWHIEGQMNEHIVAVALYYLDSENVTPTRLSFRMATSVWQEELSEQLAQDMYRSYERIFGTGLHFNDASSVQRYGSVQTPEGRLLAFPNTLQQAASAVTLQDPTKPGHQRFIALYLVDPFQRIISTGNVPPQRFDWWAEAVFGGTGAQVTKGDMPPEVFQLLLEKGVGKIIDPTEELVGTTAGNRLPAEIMDMLRREVLGTDGLMTAEEACEHRLALMAERADFLTKHKREWAKMYTGFT